MSLSRIEDALLNHWPEYLMEAAGLGLFMMAAGLFTTLLEHPHSPVHQAIADPVTRRALLGLVMGLTATGFIYSPWGQQSGAHLNPAMTMTFMALGKVAFWDAVFYAAAQFFGGALAILLVAALLGAVFAEPPVHYAATIPGSSGVTVAFLAEVVISFAFMAMILVTTNTRKLNRYTGLFAGILLAVYFIVEKPLSGMSLNPARSFASALPKGLWTHLWIYFTAPPLGMLMAAIIYRIFKNEGDVKCAKLNHHTSRRCIFNCGYRAESARDDVRPRSGQ